MQDDLSIVMGQPLAFLISKSSNFRPLYHNMAALPTTNNETFKISYTS